MARVIDLAGLAGAYATRLFAEQGHEVIRIESPEGDGLRRLPPFLGDKQDLEHGAYHQFLNAGKKSSRAQFGFSCGTKDLPRARELKATRSSLTILCPSKTAFFLKPIPNWW